MNLNPRTRVAAFFLVALVALAPAATRSQWTYYDNNSDIRALCQTGDTLWIGTNGGLLLYDLLGDKILAKFTAVDLLRDNSVRAIQRSGDQMFVGSDMGLTVLDIADSVALAPNQPTVYRDVRHVTHGPEGTLYVATLGHGVGVDGPGGFHWITKEDSLLDDKVYAVAVTDTLEMFYATSLGLCAYKDSFWVSFQAGAGIPRAEVRDILWTGGDRFYLLVGGKGVYRFDGERARRIGLGDRFAEDDIAAIAVDSTGALWAAGRYGVLARYANRQWTVIGEGDERLAGALWRSAYVGPDGTAYFGSADGLIVVAEPEHLRKIEIPSILPDGSVAGIRKDGEGRPLFLNGKYLLSARHGGDELVIENQVGPFFAIAMDPEGAVWATTPWGIVRRGKDGWEQVKPDIEPKMPLFVSLAFDELGLLWAGANTGEVYRFDGGLWVEYAARGEIANTPIHQLVIDGRRNVWALGQIEGLHRYDGSTWHTVEGGEAFGNDDILTLTRSPVGAPVVLTRTGVWRFDDRTGWEPVRVPGPAKVGEYRSIYFDGRGRTFLGTSNGVAIAAADSVLWIDSAGGLRGRDVTAMLVDADDRLWVGFQRDGISRISLESLR